MNHLVTPPRFACLEVSRLGLTRLVLSAALPPDVLPPPHAANTAAATVVVPAPARVRRRVSWRRKIWFQTLLIIQASTGIGGRAHQRGRRASDLVAVSWEPLGSTVV